jgi:methylenetetrahydrofolate dehydrogenase (NADP+)/methenyltetrahydrofolate cyclohydrolase
MNPTERITSDVSHRAEATAQILAGAPVAEAVRAGVKDRADSLKRAGRVPTLVILSVGDDPASAVYVRKKGEACAEVGIEHRYVALPATASFEQVGAAIEAASTDARVHGMIVQLPLPGHLDAAPLLRAISPDKDVDGLHPLSLGLLAADQPRFIPATPLGVTLLLRYYGVGLAHRRVTVVGRSVLVGRSLATLLSLRRPGLNATVTLCHSGTRDLARHTRDAEIVVAAVGVPETLTAEHIAPGAVVVDVGTTRVEDPARPGRYRLVGDVKADDVATVAAAMTPVPGGVGPMTVACLLANTVYAASPERGPIDAVREVLG